MIAVSLVLILVAVALLVAGVVGSTDALIVGSIAVTVFAAIVLVAGVREAPLAEPDTDPDLTRGSPRLPPPAVPPGSGGLFSRSAGHRYAEADAGATLVEDPVDTGVPTQSEDQVGQAYRVGVPHAGADPGGDRPGPVADAGDDPYDREADGEPFDDEPFDGSAAAGPAVDVVGEDDEDPPDEPAPEVLPDSAAAAVARLDTDVVVVDGRPRYHLDTCEHLDGKQGEPIAVSEAVELGFTPCGLCAPATALLADASGG